MREIDRRERGQLSAAGRGWLLVDHRGRGRDIPSVLHGAGCRRLRSVAGQTPVRFSVDGAEVRSWLTRERGPEEEGWRRCEECDATPKAGGIGSLDGPTRSVGELVLAHDRAPDLATVVAASDTDVTLEAFDFPGAPAPRRAVP